MDVGDYSGFQIEVISNFDTFHIALQVTKTVMLL